MNKDRKNKQHKERAKGRKYKNREENHRQERENQEHGGNGKIRTDKDIHIKSHKCKSRQE